MVRKCRTGNVAKISDAQGLGDAENGLSPAVLRRTSTLIVFEASRNEKRKFFLFQSIKQILQLHLILDVLQ
jgi:hypothetical protein